MLALQHLLSAPGPVTVGALARRLRVSPRAVRYDLQAADAWLRARGLPRLRHQPGVGVSFAGSDRDRHEALQALSAMTPDVYVATPRERLQLLLILLFAGEGKLTHQAVRERLSISKSTLTRTLGEASRWLSRDGLRLRAGPGGLAVEGDEADQRRAIARLMGEVLDTESRLALLPSFRNAVPPMRQPGPAAEFLRLLDRRDLPWLESCALAAQADLGVTFTDAALADLVLNLAVVVRRIRRGALLGGAESLPGPAAAPGDRPPGAVSSAVVRVAEQIQARLGCALPRGELAYLDALFRRLHVQAGGSALDVRELARCIALHAESALGCPLAGDQTLLDSLALHLGPALARIQQRAPAPPNPLLQDVQRDYPLLYQVASWATGIVRRRTGVELTPDEIGYIAMHLGAALERQRERPTPPGRILAVCPTGLATGQLLAARLQAEFGPGVTVQVTSLREVAARARQGDLIVATVPIQSTSARAVTVHPLLPRVDAARVAIALGRAGGVPSATDLIDSIMALVARYATITDPPGLRQALSRLVTHRPDPALWEGGQPMLRDLLTERTVALDVEADTWEDAVRAAGSLLVADGSVTPAYVEAMVQTIQSLGPYIVLVPGVAVAHARYGAHVLRVGMSLVRLRRPVAFGAGENDPVDLVFAFGSPDNASHLKALSGLARLLGDADALRRLREATEVEEVVRLIQ